MRADPGGVAVKRTTPSMGRMLALLAGTAGLGFGSTAVAQRHGRELLEDSVRVRVAQPAPAVRLRVPKPHVSPVAARAPKPHHAAAPPKPHRPPPTSSPAQAPASTPAPAPALAQVPAPAQAVAPTLQAPAQAPAPATQAPASASASVVSGGS